VRLWVCGLEGEGLAVARTRVVQPAKVLQREAHVVVWPGETGLEGDRPAVTRNGIVEPPDLPQRKAEIAVRLREVRFDGEGPGNQFNGAAALAVLVGEGAEQVKGGRLIGLELQNLLINVRGLP